MGVTTFFNQLSIYYEFIKWLFYTQHFFIYIVFINSPLIEYLWKKLG